jgi:hypothetical protein
MRRRRAILLLLTAIGNRAATGVGRSWAQQENGSAKSVEKRVDKGITPTGQYPPGKPRPNLQGGGRWFESSIAHRDVG